MTPEQANTNDFAAEYRLLHEDELLQIWVERSGLLPEALSALQQEIRRRGLEKDAENATDAWVEPPEPKLAPAVFTYFNVSTLWFAGRELWLRAKTRHGSWIDARIDSTVQTESGFRVASRSELRYSYEFQGQKYAGRTVRDSYNWRAGNALVFEHHPGETISVRVDPAYPNISYFPSGFGWIEPLFEGAMGIFTWLIVLDIAIAIAVFAVRIATGK